MTAGGLVADVTHPHGTGWFWGRLDGAHLSATKVRQEEVLDASEHVDTPLPPTALWLLRGLVLQRTAELVGHDVSLSTARTPRDRQGPRRPCWQRVATIRGQHLFADWDPARITPAAPSCSSGDATTPELT